MKITKEDIDDVMATYDVGLNQARKIAKRMQAQRLINDAHFEYETGEVHKAFYLQNEVLHYLVNDADALL